MKLLDKIMGKTHKKNKVVVEIIAKKGHVPEYRTEQSVGADLRASLNTPCVVVKPGKRIIVPTGVKIALPAGYEAQVRPRSGLSSKGIDVAFGTIDADYRGEIHAIVINNSDDNFTVENGMRISQLVIAKCPEPRFIYVSRFEDETERGENGFGHTGIK